MMWNGFEGMGWGWIGLGMIHVILFWVLVILGIAALVRALSGGGTPGQGERPQAMDILKARYAKGGITREQFEQMKRDIGEAA
jgi:putative membrane protein